MDIAILHASDEDIAVCETIFEQVLPIRQPGATPMRVIVVVQLHTVINGFAIDVRGLIRYLVGIGHLVVAVVLSPNMPNRAAHDLSNAGCYVVGPIWYDNRTNKMVPTQEDIQMAFFARNYLETTPFGARAQTGVTTLQPPPPPPSSPTPPAPPPQPWENPLELMAGPEDAQAYTLSRQLPLPVRDADMLELTEYARMPAREFLVGVARGDYKLVEQPQLEVMRHLANCLEMHTEALEIGILSHGGVVCPEPNYCGLMCPMSPHTPIAPFQFTCAARAMGDLLSGVPFDESPSLYILGDFAFRPTVYTFLVIIEKILRGYFALLTTTTKTALSWLVLYLLEYKDDNLPWYDADGLKEVFEDLCAEEARIIGISGHSTTKHSPPRLQFEVMWAGKKPVKTAMGDLISRMGRRTMAVHPVVFRYAAQTYSTAREVTELLVHAGWDQFSVYK